MDLRNPVLHGSLDSLLEGALLRKDILAAWRRHYAQTQLVRFALDSNLLWICCGFVQQFSDKSTTNRTDGVLALTYSLIQRHRTTTADDTVAAAAAATAVLYRSFSQNGIDAVSFRATK